MTDTKVKCINCGAEILPTTAARTGGLCRKSECLRLAASSDDAANDDLETLLHCYGRSLSRVYASDLPRTVGEADHLRFEKEYREELRTRLDLRVQSERKNRDRHYLS